MSLNPLAVFARISAKARRGRNRIVLANAALSLVGRGISILTLFLSVPLILQSVGRERYGIWSACLGIAGLLTLADGGITVHLISRVARAKADGDIAQIRRLIASAMVMATATAVPLAIIWIFVSGWVDWVWLLSLSQESYGQETRWILVILCLSYALSFVPTVIRNARIGLLQGPSVNLWDIVSGLVTLGLIATLMLKGKGIVALALVWGLTPVAIRLLHAIAFLLTSGREFLPRWRDLDSSVMKSLLGGGGAYLAVVFLQILALQSDQAIVSHILGADQVTDYAVLQRLFAQPQILVAVVVTSQWAPYADAAGRGEHGWVKRMLKFSLLSAGLLSLVTCLLIAIFLKLILHLWVGDKIVTSYPLITSMIVFGITSTIGSVFIYFNLAMHNYRRLIKSNIAMLLIIYPLDLVLIPQIGSAGAAIAVSIAYIAAIIIPGLVHFRGYENEKASPQIEPNPESTT